LVGDFKSPLLGQIPPRMTRISRIGTHQSQSEKSMGRRQVRTGIGCAGFCLAAILKKIWP